MRLFKKAVILSWCLTVASCGYAGVHAVYDDHLRGSSLVLFGGVLYLSGIVNFVYSVLSAIPSNRNRGDDPADGR